MHTRLWVFSIALVLLGCPTGGDDDTMADDDTVADDDSVSDDDDVGDDDSGAGDDDSAASTDVDEDGWTVEDGDCDDGNPSVHPDAAEVPYDGVDQDCDGADLTDVDEDGYDGYEAGGDDCDDDNPDVRPNADETCDGVDADCDGQLEVWGESDADGDGWMYCQGDCDDQDASLSPDDADGDSYSTCQGDCDDADASVNPSVAEVADGLDNDCDGTVDEGIVACTIAVPTDHTTIQAAIDASESGDVICVNAGTYVENIDFTGKAIEVLGVDGRAVTVIDGDAAGSVVTIASNEGADSILHGFTLTGGRATNGGGLHIDGASPTVSALAIDDNYAHDDGGGAYVYGSDVSMSDVSFTDNRADEGGGGLFVEESAGAVYTGLTVDGNVADDTGGGIHIFSDYSGSTVVTLSDLVVSSNLSWYEGGGLLVHGPGAVTVVLSDAGILDNESVTSEGGGIYVSGSNALSATDLVVMGNRAELGGGIRTGGVGNQFTRLVVANNTTDGYDGGAGMSGYMADETTIADALFIGNYTFGSGGGLAFSQSDDVVMNNVAFINNEAEGGGGGGLYLGTSNLHVTNGLFAGNLGGAIDLFQAGISLSNTSLLANSVNGYGAGGLYGYNSGIVLENSIIASNSSLGSGGIEVSGTLIMTNTIVIDNQGSTYGGGLSGYYGQTYELNNNDVYGNSPDDYHDIDDPTGTNGNISVDPLFLDLSSPDPLDWDLHLDLTSSLIDAGDPTILDPDGSPSDIGAFGGPNAEFWDLDRDGFPLWWQPGPYDHATYPDEGWDCDDMDAAVFPGSGC
jgi:hypothetical protein